MDIALGMVGWFAGYFLGSRVGVWIAATRISLKHDPVEGATKWRRIASSTFLHSGPWLLAVAVVFVVYLHSKVWAPWFFGGAIIGAVAYIVLVLSILRKVRRKKGENAA